MPLEIIETDEIASLLDATRRRYGLSSDEKLAQFVGVSGQAIYRWRRGQIDKSARILATLARQTEPQSTQNCLLTSTST